MTLAELAEIEGAERGEWEATSALIQVRLEQAAGVQDEGDPRWMAAATQAFLQNALKEKARWRRTVALVAEVRKLKELLQRFQYVEEVCPECSSSQRKIDGVVHVLPIGHSPDCALAEAIR